MRLATPRLRCSHLLRTALFIAAGLFPATVEAQSWRAEQQRLDAQMEKAITDAREGGATDISGVTERLEGIFDEYLEMVLKPRLGEARSCRQRMDAVEMVIGVARQMALFGINDAGMDSQLNNALASTYGNEMYERCMNELYRECVLEDNPLFARTMIAWEIGAARSRQLLGGSAADAGPLGDPRTTKCRGPWYQVGITFDESGTDAADYPWKTSDVLDGWLGRGLNLEGTKPESAPHPGDFRRRMEQVGRGARCPDGDCAESCAFTAVAEGRARVEYQAPDEGEENRWLGIGWNDDDEVKERLVRNECPHSDVPISFSSSYMAAFPLDVITPLTASSEAPPGVNPRDTDAMDPWPRMFTERSVELTPEGGTPLGRLAVRQVCDGEEIWGRGTAACQQKWREYLEYFDHLTPLAPWDRVE